MDSTIEKITVEPHLIFKDFNHFPNSPFINLEFNAVLEESKHLLDDLNYSKQGEHIYNHLIDSTTIIFSEETTLTNFKVYLKNTYYLINNIDLFTQLSKQATQCIGTFHFAEMDFKGTKKPFKLTYFTSSSSIRISYQLTTPHH
jgi:hypothetical protein